MISYNEDSTQLCGRPIDGHTPVAGAETGPLVAPLLVVAVAPGSSGGAVPDVNFDPTLGTPMSQEIVIKAGQS